MTRHEFRSEIERLVRGADVEVIPLRSVEETYRVIPRDTTVTITCSPKFGLDRTLAHVELAVASGLSAVPHLAARQVRDHEELADIVGRLGGLGVTQVFVIGGDAEAGAGVFDTAEDLLVGLESIQHPFTRIGVACYPEGHPNISDRDLLDALLRKQRHAHYMVSQLCFDVDVLIAWLADVRSKGVELPLRIGLAAPLNSRKLIELSMKIGVGSSVRFISKQHGAVRNLLLGTSYRPERMLGQMAERFNSPELGIDGLHVFSFNQVEATVAWQQQIPPTVWAKSPDELNRPASRQRRAKR